MNKCVPLAKVAASRGAVNQTQCGRRRVNGGELTVCCTETTARPGLIINFIHRQYGWRPGAPADKTQSGRGWPMAFELDSRTPPHGETRANFTTRALFHSRRAAANHDGCVRRRGDYPSRLHDNGHHDPTNTSSSTVGLLREAGVIT